LRLGVSGVQFGLHHAGKKTHFWVLFAIIIMGCMGMRLYILVLLCCCSFALYANDEIEQHEIQLRIQPIGKVSVQNKINSDNKSVGEVVMPKEPGEETYTHYCIVCHRDGLAGAPRFRNEQDWKSHLAGRKLDDLVASSIKGLNAMPAKGTCIKCMDEDLKAAISYMLPKS
jgi:cytochrome c5